jgi:hypothetical protein
MEEELESTGVEVELDEDVVEELIATEEDNSKPSGTV